MKPTMTAMIMMARSVLASKLVGKQMGRSKYYGSNRPQEVGKDTLKHDEIERTERI